MKTAGLPIPENTRKAAIFNRNRWQLSAGTGGNFQPEWVAVLSFFRSIHPPVFKSIHPGTAKCPTLCIRTTLS